MNSKNPVKKLLQCAIKAGADVNAKPIENNSDREWLNEAVKNITSAHTNLIDRLKECLHILHAFQSDSSLSVDDIATTMEEIASLCEDIDLACDFHKIGGFPAIIQFLKHSNSNLRLNAADVLATVSQNNEYCQDILLKEHNALGLLLEMSIQLDTDVKQLVAIKAMYAISCLIRQNSFGIDNFLASNGFEYLLEGLKSNNAKLKLKIIFLLRSLCKENHNVHEAINSNNFLKTFLSLLNKYESFEILEFTLDTLITINCHHVEFRKKCKSGSEEFKTALNNILQNDSIKKDHFEIVQYSQQLMKILNLNQ